MLTAILSDTSTMATWRPSIIARCRRSLRQRTGIRRIFSRPSMSTWSGRASKSRRIINTRRSIWPLSRTARWRKSPPNTRSTTRSTCSVRRRIRRRRRMEFGAERRSDELFRAERVSKSYGHIQILHDVSLVVPPRSIVGLVGENGAGKTTLFNILTGLTRPDAGAMHYRGEPYSPRAYNEAFALGISRVFQEQALVLNVPVYENLVLSQESRL